MMQLMGGNIAWRNMLDRAPRAKGQQPMRCRPAGTYRGARRNQERTSARCRALKEERQLLEVGRRELDRMRHARWQLIKLAESNKEANAALEAQAAKFSEIAQRAIA